MSSASVFSPHLLAELHHIRKSNLNTSANFTQNVVALSTVKRSIFGPVDHEECRNFVERQLNEQLQQGIEYWGFDFRSELPLPGKSRFKWEAIPDKQLSRPQKRQCDSPIYDISHLYPEPLDEVRPDVEQDNKQTTLSNIEKTKQSLITDFLKSKKNGPHLLSKLKKTQVTPSPIRTGKITRSRRTIRS